MRNQLRPENDLFAPHASKNNKNENDRVIRREMDDE